MGKALKTRITQFLRHPRSGAFSIERLYADVRGAMPPDFEVSVWTCRNPSRGLWPRLQDAWSARMARDEVNHVTGDVHYLTFFLGRHRTIITIHDMVSLGRLHGIRRWLLWLLWYWLPVKLSSAVVTVSESTRTELIYNIKCDPKKIRVIHNNVSDEFSARPRIFDELCPRILQIGTGQNKNLVRVIQALSGIDCVLIIVGKLDSVHIDSLERYSVRFENYVNISREDILNVYAGCDMLVFTSTYEGFGLPIIEANAVGRPVVTSSVLSMPEVAGDAAVIVDPFDVDSIRQGIMSVIANPEYRLSLVEAGYKNAARFSATETALKYASLYREVSRL